MAYNRRVVDATGKPLGRREGEAGGTIAPMTSSAPPDNASLIEYPCAFPIKVMGANVPGFPEAIAHVARQFDPTFDAATLEQRPSKAGNYLGLTVTVVATSREQLDELYRTLTTHPMVKVVL
jgi:putative lipoic acid-binding regulatory protein